MAKVNLTHPFTWIHGSTGKRYAQFPAFLRAIIHNQLKSTD